LLRQRQGVQAIRDFAQALRGDSAICHPWPGAFPDHFAPIIGMRGGRELLTARWGIRPPFEGLKGKNRDPSVTNIRNVASPHWRRWLELENRCVVPSSSFSDNEVLPDGMRPPVWLASMRTGR
jgi:hypothetical protein